MMITENTREKERKTGWILFGLRTKEDVVVLDSDLI